MTRPSLLVQRRLWGINRPGPAALRLAQLRLDGKPIASMMNRDHKTVPEQVDEPPEQLLPAAESEVK